MPLFGISTTHYPHTEHNQAIAPINATISADTSHATLNAILWLFFSLHPDISISILRCSCVKKSLRLCITQELSATCYRPAMREKLISSSHSADTCHVSYSGFKQMPTDVVYVFSPITHALHTELEDRQHF